MEADQNLVRNLETLAVHHPNAMVNLNTEPLVVRVKPAVERMDKNSAASAFIPHYPMGSRPKGLALIINIFKFQGNVHKEREGAYIDSENMFQLFEQLGYQTEKHENLTKAVR
ncbi:hypothetical protein B566_EDAN012280 [Ephemera danica]|nr:hypothetical protein B566_EDAN012280 [Ephemera danica]